MVLKTEICDLLGIKYPILQGGMAWAATGELAASVSEAGGLGIIGSGNAPPTIIQQEIKKVRQLTKRPFGVNVMLLSPFVDDIVKIIVSENVPVVTTGAGNPGKYIDNLKQSGCYVIPVVSSVTLARRLEKVGVDAVIAEGTEAGGHVGDLTTMVLVPQIADAVNIPVIAAGGIADGRGLVAAFALGARGIQMGTRFLCAQECHVHPQYKEMIMKAQDRSTVITGHSLGHPVRVIRNKLSKQFEQMEKQGVDKDILEALGNGRLAAAVKGDVVNGSVMAGQCAGMIRDEKKSGEIIKQVAEEARLIIERMNYFSLAVEELGWEK